MSYLLRNRLVLQLLFTSMAAISLVAVSVVLIADAVHSAESYVVGEAGRTLASALTELRQQFEYRSASDTSWNELPASAKDLSLRGVTQTVLRSYPGVEGGFYTARGFLGYAFPTHDTGGAKFDMPVAERDLIADVTQKSLETKSIVERVVRGRANLLIIAGLVDRHRTTVSWAMKRLVVRGNSALGVRQGLLAALIAAALFSIVVTLATGVSVARGVRQIRSGLARLETDFNHPLPERTDELGSISRSINRMAEVRRKLEAEVRREDRLRALGRLTAGMAHEIRNPLNSIRLTVQLLERRLTSGTLRSEDLAVVRNEVDRLNTLLNDLLGLQRTRVPKPVQQGVHPVILHCIELVRRQASLQDARIRLEAGEGIEAFFDSQQLTQTLVNLLLNALEASPPGGVVRVNVTKVDSSVHIEVKDEGEGLNNEQKEHLFEPFYTTKSSGTGLGLAVSRELMRSQGGELFHLASERGACFVIQMRAA